MIARFKFRSGSAWLAISPLLLALAGPVLAQAPVLTVAEPDLGEWVFQGLDDPSIELQVLENDPLDFSWLAEPGQPDADIVGYRYGWDVTDPDDPFDPNWATDLDPGVLSAPTRTYSSGVHWLYVEVQDDLGGVTRGGIRMQIVPPVGIDARAWSAVKALFD